MIATEPADIEPNASIAETIARERPRLRNWIRRRLADETEIDDVLQDVFFELVQAYRLTKPIEDAGAWLFRVARNRLIDLFRKNKPQALTERAATDEEEDALRLDELLPALDGGPESAYARALLIDELQDALAALPPEQREVFLAHEVEGLSFQQLSERSGVNVNTLLSRKRYAVLRLGERLQAIYDDFREREETT